MNNINSLDPIDATSISGFFELSTWQAWLAISFVGVVIITFIIYSKLTKKTKSYPMAFGFALAGIGSLIFGLINQFFPPEQLAGVQNIFEVPIGITDIGHEHGAGEGILTWHTEVTSWLGMLTSIYLGLIIIAIPLYVFVNLVSALVKKRGNKLTGKTVGVNVVALGLMPLIGVAIAFALFPLIQFLIPEGTFSNADAIPLSEATTLPGVIKSIAPATLSIFGSIAGIASVSILALIFGFVIRKMKSERAKNANSIINFFEIGSDLMGRYMKLIFKMVPLVIATRLPLFSMSNFSMTGQVVGGFIAIYFIGWIAIFLIQSIMASFLVGKKSIWMNIKRWFQVQIPTMVEVFAHNNTVAMTPKIIKNSRKLGSCNGVASFNGNLSTSLGTTMCGGFYPATILLTTLVATGGETSGVQLGTMFALTSIITLLIPHAPGSDVTLNVSLLGMFGMTTGVFEVMFTFMPINEPLNQMLNTNGKVLSALITEKFHRNHKYDSHCKQDGTCNCETHFTKTKKISKEESMIPLENLKNLKESDKYE